MMARFLRTLGRFCARHSLVVIVAWLVTAGAVVAGVSAVGARTSNDLSLPGTGSQAAKDLLAKRFPPQQNGVNPIVFAVPTGALTDAERQRAVSESVQAIADAPHVAAVTDPLSSEGQTAGLLSDDGRTAFAPVLLDIGSGELTPEIAERILAATGPADRAGVTVAAGGSIGSTLSTDDSEISEIVGIVAAMIILSLVLGSLVAMGLPIITAVAGLGVALGIVGLLGHALSIPSAGPTLATMIGLGVGIDYALFLITRHQDQLRAGLPVTESVAQAVATAGSAIVFAGCTVVIALLALGVAGIPLVSALGIASAVAVVAAVLVAITLLPAFLGLLGHRIAWLPLPSPTRGRSHRTGLWAGWARIVHDHPVIVSVLSLAAVAPLVLPVLDLELGQEDVGATSPQTTQRQAYDLITTGFGVGYNGPLQIASALDPVATPSAEFTQKYDRATAMQDDLEDKQQELPREQQQLEQQQARLEARQRSLEAQGAALRTQQADLERQAAALRSQQADLEGQAARLRSRQQQLQARQTRLEAERATLRRQAEALAARARPLVRDLVRLDLRERVLQRRIARAQDRGRAARVARLRARLAEVRTRQADVRDQLAPLERQARRLADRARTLERQAARLQRQADALRSQAAGLERRKSALERQAADLRAQGDRLQAEAADLRSQGDELQQQADALQASADRLRAAQQQAEQEKQQAEQLQTELTAMLTAAGGDQRGTDPRVVALQAGLTATDGVAALTPPQLNGAGDVLLLSAVPATAPASDDTADLVARVRDTVLPATNTSGITSYVGGYTASYVDLAAKISARLLLVIGTVVLLGYLLLMVAFRSLLIPLQAALTNVLSAAAAFGVLTATFQWGWGVSLLGLDTAAGSVPIASYVPLMMFAGLFGLSMDYEVFLVSHLQQHHQAGEGARAAVRSALASSARITTTAALIMASVFASFILNDDPTIKQFGVGLSVAVLLAGLLVVTLAPALLVLAGPAAWWLPRWLDRLLPHISIEGDEPATRKRAGSSNG